LYPKRWKRSEKFRSTAKDRGIIYFVGNNIIGTGTVGICPLQIVIGAVAYIGYIEIRRTGRNTVKRCGAILMREIDSSNFPAFNIAISDAFYSVAIFFSIGKLLINVSGSAADTNGIVSTGILVEPVKYILGVDPGDISYGVDFYFIIGAFQLGVKGGGYFRGTDEINVAGNIIVKFYFVRIREMDSVKRLIYIDCVIKGSRKNAVNGLKGRTPKIGRTVNNEFIWPSSCK
jgi:hypothetical protein